MKKIFYLFSVAIFATILFNACGQKKSSGNTPTTDEGVVINGVKWATRNVGSTGTFVTTTEDYGNYYTWEQAKTACPKGWRLPTDTELELLINYGNTCKTNGMEFGSAPKQFFCLLLAIVTSVMARSAA